MRCTTAEWDRVTEALAGFLLRSYFTIVPRLTRLQVGAIKLRLSLSRDTAQRHRIEMTRQTDTYANRQSSLLNEICVHLGSCGGNIHTKLKFSYRSLNACLYLYYELFSEHVWIVSGSYPEGVLKNIFIFKKKINK